LFLLLVFLIATITLHSQVKIIFDTDFGGDADDLGALTMLHNFVDREECELLAVMCWTAEQYAVPAIDAINRFHEHPDIPIGARKDGTHYQEWNYSKSIADRFPNELDHNKVPDATVLYRQILTDSPDQSVVIITVGPLKNIENLINSKGDAISELDGKALIEKKVKEFVIMGGNFPEGEWEWNFNGGMPGVTRFVIKNLSVPVTFTGFEVGVAIKTGKVFNEIDPNTPLYVGFLHFSENAPWMEKNFTGEILDNSTFDQTAILYAVRDGVGTYWDRVTGGICVPDEKGGNTWDTTNNSNQSYLKLTMDDEEIAELIESIMLGEF